MKGRKDKPGTISATWLKIAKPKKITNFNSNVGKYFKVEKSDGIRYAKVYLTANNNVSETTSKAEKTKCYIYGRITGTYSRNSSFLYRKYSVGTFGEWFQKHGISSNLVVNANTTHKHSFDIFKSKYFGETSKGGSGGKMQGFIWGNRGVASFHFNHPYNPLIYGNYHHSNVEYFRIPFIEERAKTYKDDMKYLLGTAYGVSVQERGQQFLKEAVEFANKKK